MVLETHTEDLKHDTPDTGLITSALSGDQNAYTLLMLKYKEGVTLYVQEFLGNLKNTEGNFELAEEPQDIVQEANI